MVNSRVDELNHRLNTYLSDVDGAQLFRLKGFRDQTKRAEVVSPDGVHLNGEGNKKYYNNIRSALVSFMKHGPHSA